VPLLCVTTPSVLTICLALAAGAGGNRRPRGLRGEVPTISRFYGIKIQMFHNDHGVPHFHARFAGREATFSLVDDLTVLRGGLPRPAERLVRRWAARHRAELMSNWKRARSHEPLQAIPPLG